MVFLIQRVKNILVRPEVEWHIIEKETTTTADLYKNYIVPLAAIGPVEAAIGFSLTGEMLLTIKPITILVGWYGLALLVPYGLAFLINILAPTFAGQKNFMQALKVGAYICTPVWLAEFFMLIPMPIFGILLFLSLYYSNRLLELGLPVVMKVPQKKASVYTAIVVIVVLVVFFLGVAAMLHLTGIFADDL